MWGVIPGCKGEGHLECDKLLHRGRGAIFSVTFFGNDPISP